MTVILVRHGESEGNAQRIIQGWLDTALTPLGEHQAEAVGRRLSAYPLAAIYDTPLQRAAHTARAIAVHHGLATTETLPPLAERQFGEAQGLSWDDVQARWGGAGGRHDWWASIPDVEPLPDVRARAAQVIEDLLDRHDGELAVAVSHGGTIGQIVAYTLGMAPDDWPRIQVANTSVTVISREGGRPVIRLLNDLCHLRPAEETAPPAV